MLNEKKKGYMYTKMETFQFGWAQRFEASDKYHHSIRCCEFRCHYGLLLGTSHLYIVETATNISLYPTRRNGPNLSSPCLWFYFLDWTSLRGISGSVGFSVGGIKRITGNSRSFPLWGVLDPSDSSTAWITGNSRSPHGGVLEPSGSWQEATEPPGIFWEGVVPDPSNILVVGFTQ